VNRWGRVKISHLRTGLAAGSASLTAQLFLKRIFNTLSNRRDVLHGDLYDRGRIVRYSGVPASRFLTATCKNKNHNVTKDILTIF